MVFVGAMNVISGSARPFADRIEAGKLLAGQLSDYKGFNPVVLGVPRGGVVVAEQLGLALGAEVDVVLSRKLGAPGNPELAIGAIAEDGSIELDEHVVAATGATSQYIETEKAASWKR